MRRNWWIIISYIFATIVFLIVASYAVLFATGYKYDWQNKSFKKTGFILIETYPKDATVTIAGKHINKKTPVIIRRLLPGNYLTEIRKEGYRPWQAVIEVESGLVTEQRNLLLTLDKLSEEKLREKTVDKMVISPNYEKLALVSGKEVAIWNVETKHEVSVYDPALVRQRITTQDNYDVANGTIQTLLFGPDNKTLLMQVVGRLNVYHVLLNSNTGQIKVLTKGRNIGNWQWLNGNELIFMQGSSLYLTGFEAKENKKIIDSVISYGVVDGSIYGTVKDELGKHSLIRIEKNQTARIEIDEVAVAIQYQIHKIKNNWVLVTKSTSKSPANIWWYEPKNNEDSWNQLASNITSKVLWDNSSIIYQVGNKITATKIDLNNKLETREIFTAGSQLAFASFHFDTLLYNQAGILKSLDLTGENNYTLFSVKNATEIVATDSQMSQIIYINPTTRELHAATLREKTKNTINLDRLINRLN
ncbi:PEGA domain-containing protein [Patescibacteria group bacterium]|nr:PEGA domain-containing protein [Patescibacteria group bacterium]